MGITTVLTIAVVVWLAFIVSKRMKKYAEEHKDDPMRSFRLYSGPEAEKSNKRVSWLDHIHSIWWMLGAGIGALKYIYKAWKTAPLGSAAKFGWGALLGLMAAIALFALLKLIDRKLNPPDGDRDVEAQRNDAPTTHTSGRMTDQWEYKR